MPYRCLHCDHTCDHPTQTSAACSASGCGFKAGHFRYEHDGVETQTTSRKDAERRARSALIWCWAPIGVGVALWAWGVQESGGRELLAVGGAGLAAFGAVIGGRSLTALLRGLRPSN